MSKEYTIRVMTLEDYDEVYALWMGIHGFGIRSIDDSRRSGAVFKKKSDHEYGSGSRWKDRGSHSLRT